MQVPSRLASLARVGLLALGLSGAGIGTPLAQRWAWPQFFAGGQPPTLTNSRLAQRTTLLCNDAYAVLASGGDAWADLVRRAADGGKCSGGTGHRPRERVLSRSSAASSRPGSAR